LGLLQLPDNLGGAGVLLDFLQPVFKNAFALTRVRPVGHDAEWFCQGAAFALTAVGMFMAWIGYSRSRNRITGSETNAWIRLSQSGLGFDWLYRTLFVRPFVWLARRNANDILDRLPQGLVLAGRGLHLSFSKTQTGHLRHSLLGVVMGAFWVLLLAWVLL
jgi:NADH-quinone oxidoreductase subunit L